jgi:hypothetical protein
MIAIVDPWRADAELVAKVMPPLWQYLSSLLKRLTQSWCPKIGTDRLDKPDRRVV